MARTPPVTSPTDPGLKTPLPTIDLLGIPLHAITEQQCVDHLIASSCAGIGGVVVTPNLDHLRRLVQDPTFRSVCKDADLVVADGMPLVWASRLRRTPLPERVAGSSLIHSVPAACAARGRRVFFLGGEPGTALRTADILQSRHRDLQVAGTCCPDFGFEKDPVQVAALLQILRTSAPDVIFVALGSPKQEQLIARLRDELPKAWWLGIGISFSFVCGDVRRAPRWLQRIGLEWAHRLVQEPRRLAKRYLVHGLPFATRLLLTSAWQGIRAPRAVDQVDPKSAN